MRVKMKTLSASPDGVLSAGKEYDLPPMRAKELIAAGAAVAAVEVATRERRETTTTRSGAGDPEAAARAKAEAEAKAAAEARAKELDGMTKPVLAELAKGLGLELDHNAMKKDAMIAQIQEAEAKASTT